MASLHFATRPTPPLRWVSTSRCKRFAARLPVLSYLVGLRRPILGKSRCISSIDNDLPSRRQLYTIGS